MKMALFLLIAVFTIEVSYFMVDAQFYQVPNIPQFSFPFNQGLENVLSNLTIPRGTGSRAPREGGIRLNNWAAAFQQRNSHVQKLVNSTLAALEQANIRFSRQFPDLFNQMVANNSLSVQIARRRAEAAGVSITPCETRRQSRLNFTNEELSRNMSLCIANIIIRVDIIARDLDQQIQISREAVSKARAGIAQCRRNNPGNDARLARCISQVLSVARGSVQPLLNRLTITVNNSRDVIQNGQVNVGACTADRVGRATMIIQEINREFMNCVERQMSS